MQTPQKNQAINQFTKKTKILIFVKSGLLHVVWSMGTTPNRTTNETRLTLLYRAEAVLPTKLLYGSPRVRAFDEAEQQQLRQGDVVIAEEIDTRATTHAGRYQQRLCRYHNCHVHS